MIPRSSLRPRLVLPLLVVLAGAGAALLSLRAPAREEYPMESLWYLVNSEESVQAFLDHADRVTIVAPQVFRVNAQGAIRGEVDGRVLRVAREKGIRVMPLVYQAGFDLPTLRKLLASPEARLRAAGEMAQLCRDGGFWGIQLDLEHIHVSDRDRLTEFYREATDALHHVGCISSIAVVPRTSDSPARTPYHRWMHDFWRGAYDYRALAATGDFVTLMAYDQHTRYTPPGPVASLPWVERALEYMLGQGVPPEKVLLGVPAYSRIWSPTASAAGDPSGGTRGLNARGVSYREALALLRNRGARLRWDEKGYGYSTFWENDGVNEFLFVENAETFEHRLALIRKYRLRGFAAWRLGHEDPGVWRLLGRRTLVAR